MPRSASLLHRALRGQRTFVSEGPYIRDTTQRFGKHFPCFYCLRVLHSEAGRARHILSTQSCQAAYNKSLRAKSLSHAQDDPRILRVLEPELDKPTTSKPTRRARFPTGSQVDSRPASPLVFPPPALPPALLPRSQSEALEYDPKRQLFIERYPDPYAGAPINEDTVAPINLNLYMANAGNLGNPDYFDTAELLMTTGLTNGGRDAHLKSRLVSSLLFAQQITYKWMQYQGQTPWVNNKNMITDIDTLPHGPGWEVYDIRLNESAQRQQQKHTSYLFMRSVVATFRDLLAEPAFRDHMQYAPRRDWTTADRKCRVYGETCSGDWWWKMQERLPDRSATVVPLIIAHDRMALSVMSGGHQAYPVYLTLGNIDKSVRRKLTSRATVLLAYLPVDKFTYVKDDTERSRLKRELTHRAMEKLFEELHITSKDGVETLCADGRYRRAYPIVAGVVLDNEDQVLASGILSSGCPKCKTTYHNRGSGKLAPPRTNHETLCAMHEALENADWRVADILYLQPIWPWWANLPYVDFAGSLMPDILHQLHQGMLKHLLKWTYKAVGEKGPAMVDRYFAAMPNAEGMRHFRQGVSAIKQWTGRESKEVEKQLLPIIASLDAKRWDQDFVKLARALLDFIYRAQASRMTEDDIARLERTLVEIHELKSVLKRVKVFQNDSRYNKIAKLHLLSHWPNDTRQMGTADGFSTESPEHMHIQSKRAWRASNKVRPTPQMIKFIQRYEGLRIHRARMNTYLGRVSVESDKRRRSRVVYGEDEDVPFEPTWEPSGSHSKNLKMRNVDASDEFVGGIVDAAEDGDGDEDEGNNEGEDEDQQHYPSRMRTATEARQQVVYPNPTLSIAIKPTSGRVSGIDIAAKYGATHLISALHKGGVSHPPPPDLDDGF